MFAQFAAYAFFLFPYLNYGNWYFGPFYLACVIMTTILWDEWPGQAGRHWLGAVAALLLLLNTATFLFFHDETKINIMGGKECLAYIDAHYQGRRIGAWNAGYLGYFSTRNTFVNLDGLVNNDELAHLIFTGASLDAYLAANRIDLLCDYQTDPAAIRAGFYGLPPAQYQVRFTSRYYQPAYIDPRIYYVLELHQ